MTTLSVMPEWADQQLNDKLGIQFTEISADRVVGTMPVEGNRQPYGLLHGGATLSLIEAVGSVAAAVHALPERSSVGLEVNVTHLRSAVTGSVTAVATPVHAGGTVACYEVAVTDDEGRTISRGRITCLLRPLGNLQSRAATG